MENNINIKFDTDIIIFTGKYVNEGLEQIPKRYIFFYYPTSKHYSERDEFNKEFINDLKQRNRKAFIICQLDEIIMSLVSTASGIDLIGGKDCDMSPDPYNDKSNFDEINKILKVVRFDIHNDTISATEYDVRDMLICYASQQEYR